MKQTFRPEPVLNERITVPPTTFAIDETRWAPFRDGLVSPTAARVTWNQVYVGYGQRPGVDRDQIYIGHELVCIAVYLKIPEIECHYMPEFKATDAADRIAEIFRHAKRTTDSSELLEGSSGLGDD